MSFLAVALGVSALSQGASYIGSRREGERARRKARGFEEDLKRLEENRQGVINPYEDITNPYENLQVATGAAEFQAEETDIALANSLDTLNSAGYSAGGATALAQAALRGKQDISNNIQMQEAENAKLMAEGRARQEQLFARGEAFKFNAQEFRDNVTLDRYAGLSQQYRNLEQGYRQQGLNSLASFGQTAMEFGAGFETSTQTGIK